MFDLTEGRMIHFRYGAENHAEIAGPGSYVVLDIILPSGSESDYDSDGSRGGIPSKDLRLAKKRIEVEKEPVEDSIIRVTLKNQLLQDGASVVVSPSSPIFDCEEFLDYMTSTCLPFIIYAIEHDQLTEKVSCTDSRPKLSDRTNKKRKLGHNIVQKVINKSDRLTVIGSTTDFK